MDKSTHVPLVGKHARGRHALVDPDVHRLVNLHNWRLDRYGYARAWVGNAPRRKCIVLHNFIIRYLDGVHTDKIVDHITGDTLDNRRENLRLVTPVESARNTSSFGSSGYKGVHFDASRGAYVARISVAGERHFLGAFDEEEDAAMAYDEAALAYFKDYGRLNFPPG